jgi:hypothetical protein
VPACQEVFWTMDKKKPDEKKLREKLAKLFGMLGSANAGEHEAARGAIGALLAFNKKN